MRRVEGNIRIVEGEYSTLSLSASKGGRRFFHEKLNQKML
jgi:hypothetical protein